MSLRETCSPPNKAPLILYMNNMKKCDVMWVTNDPTDQYILNALSPQFAAGSGFSTTAFL